MKSSTWSDIASDLRIDRAGNVVVLRNDDAIQQSLRNIFSTVRGERVRSDIGSGLSSLVFEPVSEDTAEDIRETMAFSIERFENRIILLGIEVIPFPDDHYYEIVIRYRERNSISPQEMRTFLEQQQ